MEHTKNCIHTARIVAALLFLTAYLSAQEEVTPSAQLQIAADRVEYGVGSAMARGEGAVEIVYGDLRLTCDKASINQKTMNFSAHGNVEVTMAGKGSWKAEALHGNLASKAIEFGPRMCSGWTRRCGTQAATAGTRWRTEASTSPKDG